MAAYVTLIGVGCFVRAGEASGAFAALGRFLAYAQIASGLLDAFENAALVLLLLRGFDAGLMSAARLATACKSVVPTGGLLYIAIAWIVRRI